MALDLAHYTDLLGQVKQRIRQGQARAVLSANAEMISTYWAVGKILVERQQQEGWGKAVIPRLARDIRNELPEVKGFSERNIGYMIRLVREYGATPILQQAVAKLETSGKVPQPVAQTATTRALPDNLKSALPSIEDIEQELSAGSGRRKTTDKG